MTTTILLDEAVCKLDEEATAALDPVIAGAFYGARCEWSDLLLGQCACKQCRPDLADVDYGEGVDLTGVDLSATRLGGRRWSKDMRDNDDDSADGMHHSLGRGVDRSARPGRQESIPVTKVA